MPLSKGDHHGQLKIRTKQVVVVSSDDHEEEDRNDHNKSICPSLLQHTAMGTNDSLVGDICERMEYRS